MSLVEGLLAEYDAKAFLCREGEDMRRMLERSAQEFSALQGEVAELDEMAEEAEALSGEPRRAADLARKAKITNCKLRLQRLEVDFEDS